MTTQTTLHHLTKGAKVTICNYSGQQVYVSTVRKSESCIAVEPVGTHSSSKWLFDFTGYGKGSMSQYKVREYEIGDQDAVDAFQAAKEREEKERVQKFVAERERRQARLNNRREAVKAELQTAWNEAIVIPLQDDMTMRIFQLFPNRYNETVKNVMVTTQYNNKNGCWEAYIGTVDTSGFSNYMAPVADVNDTQTEFDAVVTALAAL